MLDILFIAFLGEREPEELLPEDEAERERLLQDIKHINNIESLFSKGKRRSPVFCVARICSTHLYGGQ